MKIGMDLSVTKYEGAGSTTYACSLWNALKAGYPGDVFEAFVVNHGHVRNDRKTIASRLSSVYRDLIWTPAVLPVQAARARLDVLHMPVQVVPFVRSCPTVVTIHDLFVLELPQHFPPFHRLSARFLIPRAVHEADAVIAVSQYTRQALERRFDLPPEKITVTYEAAAPHFQPIDHASVTDLRERYSLNRPFILAVGTLQPRKNIGRLLEALALLRQRGLDVQLVHVGARGWLTQAIDETISRLQLQDAVRFVGRLPTDDLVAFYNAAAVFAYPSLYEGFGLPPLEAMACGCPVVTSNTTSLPEVVGDAGLLVDPSQHADLALALEQILTDHNLARSLRERGLARAREFSWQRCAEQTYQVYQRIRE